VDIFLALDTQDPDHAARVMAATSDRVHGVKIGHVLGSVLDRSDILVLTGTLPLFLDYKLHDIPATVARGISGYRRAFPTLQVVTIHATGDDAMIRAALDAAEGQIDIAGVIGLSSMVHATSEFMATADRALGAGMTSFICPPPMIKAMRQRFGQDIQLITPGIRAARGTDDDHAETFSAADARAAGSDRLVVGRPVVDAADPSAALTAFL